jgi:hypothetical protein
MSYLSFARALKQGGAHKLSFQLLEKQPNFIRQKSDAVFGLAVACADKIQLRSKSASASWRMRSHEAWITIASGNIVQCIWIHIC